MEFNSLVIYVQSYCHMIGAIIVLRWSRWCLPRRRQLRNLVGRLRDRWSLVKNMKAGNNFDKSWLTDDKNQVILVSGPGSPLVFWSTGLTGGLARLFTLPSFSSTLSSLSWQQSWWQQWSAAKWRGPALPLLGGRQTWPPVGRLQLQLWGIFGKHIVLHQL